MLGPIGLVVGGLVVTTADGGLGTGNGLGAFMRGFVAGTPMTLDHSRMSSSVSATARTA